MNNNTNMEIENNNELDIAKAQAGASTEKASELLEEALVNTEMKEIVGKAEKEVLKGELQEAKAKSRTTGNPKIRVNKDTLEELREKFPNLTDAQCIDKIWKNYSETCNDVIESLQQTPAFEPKNREKDVENLKKMLDILIGSIQRDAEIYALEMKTSLTKANIDYIEKSKQQVTDDYLNTRRKLRAVVDIEDVKNKELEELKQQYFAEVEGLKTELETIYKKLDEKDKLVALLEEKNKTLEENSDKLNKENSKLKEVHLREIDALNKSREQEISAIEENLNFKNDKLNSENKQLSDKVLQCENKLEELKATVTELKEENAELTAKHKDAVISEKQLKELKDEVAKLKKENKQLKDNEIKVEINTLKLEFANSQADMLRTDKENLMKDKEILLEEKSNLQNEVKVLKEELEKMQEKEI